MNLDELKRSMEAIVAQWPTPAIDDDTAKTYVVLLAFEQSEVMRAIARFVARGRPMRPSAAEFVGELAPTDDIVHEVRAAISRFGRYRWAEARELLSPNALGVIEASGGWNSVCEQPVPILQNNLKRAVGTLSRHGGLALQSFRHDMYDRAELNEGTR